ncbi:MAG: hypothetical protein JRJ83_09820 [Deltaproteobacteria bacterium]|nr:hypothetical protein [Deltaproteobacteria bacterium]
MEGIGKNTGAHVPKRQIEELVKRAARDFDAFYQRRHGSATRRGLCPEARKPVDTCARYPLNHSACLRYDRYLSQGLPIATGVIEGACRHLVKDRMDVTGAEAVLRLRALRSSNDFDEYRTFHEAKEHERNHRALYAEGIVPATTVSPPVRKHARLKVIK